VDKEIYVVARIECRHELVLWVTARVTGHQATHYAVCCTAAVRKKCLLSSTAVLTVAHPAAVAVFVKTEHSNIKIKKWAKAMN